MASTLMSKAIGSTAWALVVYTRIKLSCPELSIVKIRLVTVQRYWYSSLVIDAFLLEFLKGTYSHMVLPGCCRSMLQHVFCTPAQVHEGDNQRK